MGDCLIEDLKCPICLDFCNEPVETNCCHKIFCKQCLDRLNGTCALCRSRCIYIASVFTKRLINSLPIDCEYCNEKSTRGDIEHHKLRCKQVRFDCPECENVLIKEEFLQHIIDNHNEYYLKKLNSIIDICKKDNINTQSETNKNEVSIEMLINSRGFNARLGATGKYYCGKVLDFECNCCNGNCGPTSGCNCSSCMELDIITRKLPQGWLVNKEGFISRRKDLNGLFYCGRKVIDQFRRCDGYCGPTNGPNCKSCKKLDQVVHNWNHAYFKFL